MKELKLGLSRILKLVLVIEIIVLLGNTAAISRDYQDSWILEGLEIPFAVFVVTYIAYFMVEKQFEWLIMFALIAHITFLLIPNLKYVWFQGVAIDQHLKYRLALSTYDEGYVPPGTNYSETPMLPLSFVVYSVMTGLPMAQIMKYFPLMLWFTYPIWVYIIVKKISANSSILKYTLLASSIPVAPEISYLVVGTLFGAFFVFLILIQCVKIAENGNRRNWIVAVIFAMVLVAGHSFSSMLLPVALLVATCLSSLSHRMLKLGLSKVRSHLTSTMAIFMISLAWLSLVAQRIFASAVNFFASYFGISSTGKLPELLTIRPRFFEIDFISQIRALVVFNGGDLLFMLFTIIGVLLIIRKISLRKKSGLTFLSNYAVALMFILLFGLVLNLGFDWGDRILRYVSTIAPIFSGVFLYHIESKLRNRIIPLLLVGLLVVLAVVQLYQCQLLIPAASSLGNELPNDEPLVYVNSVNTVYQRSMITYAEGYLANGTRIATDEVTGNQLFGLASWSFSENHKISYPLKTKRLAPHDYFLLHLPGISGKLYEKAEMRTRNVILSVIYNSSYNIVYSNGESYILHKW